MPLFCCLYLQSGAYKVFDHGINAVKFEQQIVASNGEDFLFVFYQSEMGLYILMPYNIIEQEVKTPIICNGFTLLETGELCYFRTEEEQTKHHVIQIWQTPFAKQSAASSENTDSLLYKIGNKDIVKAMAECQGLITLLNKEDSYDGLYDDISKQSLDILDSYYWIREKETFLLSTPLLEINQAANTAIDEFEKVVQLRKTAVRLAKEMEEKTASIFSKIKSSSFKTIDDFVFVLSQLRTVRGEVIGLKEVRYVDPDFITDSETQIAENSDKISKRCVQFLLDDKALQPYHKRVQEKQELLPTIKKVLDAKNLEKEVNQIVADLEMLIEIVSNLEIEDTAHSTKIIDNISLIFATINQLKSEIKNSLKSLGGKEASADFSAQIKLIDQSIINYLDLADTPEKVEDFQNKIAIQLEELEGKFADFPDFISSIIEKREEIYNAFETRKSSILEGRNRKAVALESSGERILKGIRTKALSFKTQTEINGYFAADLMVSKLRDIVAQLFELDDVGKAERIQTQLKTAKEDAARKLKDKQDLYEDGENVIKLGKHKFGVNKQTLDLTIVYREEALFYHLTGTDFYKEIKDANLAETKNLWDRELISESDTIYRGAYLAYSIYEEYGTEQLLTYNESKLKALVKEESSKRYTEGYVKGVHDVDAYHILTILKQKERDLGLLRFPSPIRAFAQFFWNCISKEEHTYYNTAIKASGEVLSAFPGANTNRRIIAGLEDKIQEVFTTQLLGIEGYTESLKTEIAQYLFKELLTDDTFTVSHHAWGIFESFIKKLKSKKIYTKLNTKLENMANIAERINLALQWVSSYLEIEGSTDSAYLQEIVCLLLFNDESVDKTKYISPQETISELKGGHRLIENGTYEFDYHKFVSQLHNFVVEEVPAFELFRSTKRSLMASYKKELRLNEFKPGVLSSFVRNKLIDQVYLPLFGDNLSKQLGSMGDSKRTDRMGMLLLVSPPGYGKTTLMEYLANRLGLVFMKINGPAIGHEITSVDPMAATNIAAREELKKLNLAFEMGNNVMLYLDDIQHCNPEFLQKFISLADGTRRIEGVYEGESKTYDFRSKKFCVVMAGNPYTESGDKFRIPDMLANRADIYNLGDIIGNTKTLFELSLVENSLTSNPVLHQLGSKYFDDVYQFITMAESGNREGTELQGNYTKQEINDYISVLEKVIQVRERIMLVNTNYIKSAAMDEANRLEPAFKLQGSYRDMNKLVAKIVPVMNEEELETLLLSHYENESQTLTNAAEANLLKYKELAEVLTKEEKNRWLHIKETFVKNNKLKGLGNNNMAQVLNQMMKFSEHLEGIQDVLQKGLDK